MKQVWTGDSIKTVTIPMIYPAHNPKGLGWKQHGAHGYFMKKPVKTDYDGLAIGCLGVAFFVVSGLLVWVLLNIYKPNYPITPIQYLK